MDTMLNQIDTAYGGYLSLNIGGGSVALSQAQASNPIIALTGTLGADTVVTFPAIGGRRMIIPFYTNPNGHLLYVRGNNGADTVGIYFWSAFGIPYGIVVTPSRVYWDYGQVNPGTIADMWTAWPGNGWIPCDGRYISIAQHDLLHDAIGGNVSGSLFQVPDLRGTTCAMADTIGAVPPLGPGSVNNGSRGILNGYGLSGYTYVGEANHTLATGEMPVHTHTGGNHSHGYTDGLHSHDMLGWYGVGVASAFVPGAEALINVNAHQYTAASNANITINATNIGPLTNAGGSAAHNNVQPTTTTMKMIKW